MNPLRARAWIRVALLSASALGGLVCARDPSPGPGAADAASPMDAQTLPAAGNADARPHPRAEILGPFLSEWWRTPVALQGEPPPGFSPVEASLDPAVCGACHPRQLAEWSGSLHAGAYSPGFAGQLVEGSLSEPRPLRACQTCHAPLAEQQPVDADGRPNPAYDAALRDQGIVCAACHVRAHRRAGPPRRADLPAPAGPVAHGGFEARPEFEQSRFCASCHQFFDQRGPAGKPVENIWVEWRSSPQAAAGRTCQSCHMPDRAHTWRGIHDADMVRDAVDVALRPASETAPDRVEATLVVTNRDVGHAFPSYVTPRVFLALWQADAGGEEIEGTRVEHAIGRQIDFSERPARELFDTRLLPGESAELSYAQPRHRAAVSLRGRVTVDPAYHYRGVYQRLLARYEDPRALALVERARGRADRVRYVLAEHEQPLSR